MVSIAICALWSLAEATSFMEEVIFRVFFTEAMRVFISLREATLRFMIYELFFLGVQEYRSDASLRSADDSAACIFACIILLF